MDKQISILDHCTSVVSRVAKDLSTSVNEHKWQILGVTTVAVGLYVVRRKYFSGGKCKSDVRLDGKTAIVTGANTGIGKETALDLAKRGARVILACRNVKKGMDAADEIRRVTGNGNVFVEYLDLSSFESIKNFAKKINDTEPQINLLINNAGLMACPKLKTKDGHEMQFGVNYLGHFLLTNLLLNKLINSAPSRIINVSSKLYETGRINWDDLNSENSYDPMDAYKQSKLCNILFTHELSKKLEEMNAHAVTAHSVSPGMVHTELGRHLTYGFWGNLKLCFAYPMIKFVFKTPKEGAQTTIHASIDEEAGKNRGKFYRDCKETNLLPHAKNDQDAKRLWQMSENIVQGFV